MTQLKNTSRNIDRTQFKDVPKEQQKLFFDFRKNRPYSTITFQRKEFKFLSSGQSGNTSVFLHGTLVRPDMWFYLILKLEWKFRIIAPLFPAQGMGVQKAVDLVHAILEQEKITKVILIGYSYGGGVAQYFAEKYPDFVETLVLSHTGLLRKESAKQKVTKTYKILRFMPFFMVKFLFKRRLACFSDSSWNEFHQAYFKEIFSELNKPLLSELLSNAIKYVDELPEDIDYKRTWQGKTIILATKDDKDTFNHLDSLKELYKNSEVYVFDELGGHHI